LVEGSRRQTLPAKQLDLQGKTTIILAHRILESIRFPYINETGSYKIEEGLVIG